MSKMQIPESWATATIGDIVDKVQYGANASATTKGVLQLLRITDITERGVDWDAVPRCALSKSEGQKYLLNEGDIVFARTGATVGKSYRITNVPDNAIYASYLIRLAPLEPFKSGRYFHLFFSSSMYWNSIKDGARGAAQPNVNAEILKAIEIPIPPFGEQKRIVAKIESTQEKVKTIESSISKAEQLIEKYRESLLQKAFRGELVPQHPNDEPASKLIESIRNERAKQSDGKKKKKEELPPIKPEEIPFEIPKSWEWVRLGEVVDIQGGSQPPKTEFRYKPGPGLIRLVQIRDFKSEDHLVFIPEKINKRHFSKDDIMIGRYGPPIFQILRGLEGSYNVALMKAVPSSALNKEYLFWYLQEPRIQRDVNRKSERAAGQTGVNLEFLNNYLVPIPPLAAQLRIVSFVKATLNGISDISNRVREASDLGKKLGDSVLQLAFEGKLLPQVASEGTGHELLKKIKSEQQPVAEPKTAKKTTGPKKRKKK